MKKLYVIGNNTSKSLSPTIFNYWFKKYKIKATYNFIEINKKQFNKKIPTILKQKNIIGLNITIPFKLEIIKHLKILKKEAKNINAVNCISIKNNKTIGLNTDWLGYKKSLKKFNIKKNEKIIILGYGGASMSINYYLQKEGYNNVLIFNRTKKLIKGLTQKKYTTNLKHLENHISNLKLIINTTPVNLIKKDQSKLIGNKTIISDIVYSPKNTKFLKQFKTNKKIFGISMLVNQATPCFEEWFGFEPIIDNKLLEILDKKIK